MTKVNGSNNFNQALELSTKKSPPNILEIDKNLKAVDSKTIYVNDYSTTREFKGAINKATLSLVQDAFTDGNKNVVSAETNTDEGYAHIVNYVAENTNDYIQGDSAELTDEIKINILAVDDDGSDDSSQVTLKAEVGNMLSNVPGMKRLGSKHYNANDFDSKSDIKLQAIVAALETDFKSATDGFKNIVTIETNQEDGSFAIVNYQAEDVSDFTLNEEIEMEGYLTIKVISIDKNPNDD